MTFLQTCWVDYKVYTFYSALFVDVRELVARNNLVVGCKSLVL